MKRLHASVHGRVQGVSFRYYTRLTAQRLNLTGWTRNEFDDTVTVVAEGVEADLQRLITFLHQGPPAARVTRVDVTWSEATGEFPYFDIRL